MPHIRSRLISVLYLVSCLCAPAMAQDEPPHSTDSRLKIELFAESPQVVTPTGIDVDTAGRVWVIESNTHFPPEGYQGHPSDRILVMEGRGNDGKAQKITVFKDGLTHSMSVAMKPAWLDLGPQFAGATTTAPTEKRPIELFVATRREILLCTDVDGDLKCDDVKQLVHLETSGNYPHNGLAGFAFDALGNLFFGFGENLGADYKIIGSDGTTLAGGGEGGNIYRCRPDGSKLEKWATGFWNPHASCIDAFGRMFTLDNDPDSRPPCRLLHIVQGGDYGYRFRNGRKGTHPFTSWNGEIPGTLPMVSGTGEAPSGIVSYESDDFPEDYLGALLVGSWGDHRIDKFLLKPRGVSFESMPQPFIKGGENFRPVGLAVAPDGSMYVTDWVSKEYKLHGLGRVWRVSAAHPSSPAQVDPTDATLPNFPGDAKILNASTSLVGRRRLARKLSETPDGRQTLVKLLNDLHASARDRIESLWALACVPPSVEKLNLLSSGDDPAPFLNSLDVVSVAASELLGTPQLNPPQPAPEWLVGKNLIQPGNGWSALILVRVTQYYLKSHNIAPLGYFTGSNDPFIQTAAGQNLSRFVDPAALSRIFLETDSGIEPRDLLTAFLVLRSRKPMDAMIARHGLKSADLRIRRAAVQWVGEENLKQLRPDLEQVLAGEPMTTDLFLACLASLSLLDQVAPAEFEKTPPIQHVLPIVKDVKRSASLRAIALRMVPPASKELDGKLLAELVASNNESLRREAVRTLQFSSVVERDELLRSVAANEALDIDVRADAVAGLAPADQHSRQPDATRNLLLKLMASKEQNIELRLEAIRSLRRPTGTQLDAAVRDQMILVSMMAGNDSARKQTAEQRSLSDALAFARGERPTISPQQFLVEIGVSGSEKESAVKQAPAHDRVESGRRTFFHVNAAGCYKCHAVGGRGGQVGPDLTVISRTMDRKKLAESIVEPSKEISPQFTTWSIETIQGKVLTGMLLGEEVNGDLKLGNSQGEVFYVPFNQIVTRSPLKTSIMPEKLHELVPIREFQDLLSFLESLK